jgi:GT2 family glycosyltransferase
MIVSEWTGNLDTDGTLTSYLNTANFTIDRNIFLKHRFREDLISCEDVELFIRLKQNGYKIFYEPRAVAYHHHPTTIEQLFKQFMWYGQGFFQIDTIYEKKSRNRYQTVSPVRYLDFTEDYLAKAVVLDNRLLCAGCTFDKLQKCKIIKKQLLKKKSTSEIDLHRVVCLALAAGILKQRMGINYEPTMKEYLKD